MNESVFRPQPVACIVARPSALHAVVSDDNPTRRHQATAYLTYLVPSTSVCLSPWRRSAGGRTQSGGCGCVGAWVRGPLKPSVCPRLCTRTPSAYYNMPLPALKPQAQGPSPSLHTACLPICLSACLPVCLSACPPTAECFRPRTLAPLACRRRLLAQLTGSWWSGLPAPCHCLSPNDHSLGSMLAQPDHHPIAVHFSSSLPK
jgi:hypothetical protein